MVVPAAQQPADAEQWIASVPAVAEGLRLDAAADLVEGVRAQFYDMEGIEYSGGVRQAGS
jgi:hypothetical protein